MPKAEPPERSSSRGQPRRGPPLLRAPFLERDLIPRLLATSEVIAALGAFLPGHYYSPYPSPEDVDRASSKAELPAPSLPGIDLNVAEQLELLAIFGGFYEELDFPTSPDPEWRYAYENDFFRYGDAASLYAMIRHLQPHRIIEVGSGFSSMVVLDTNERNFDNEIECLFIDPEPERFLGLLRPDDLDRNSLIPDLVQNVALSTFDSLGPGDILFIDSSHVSKGGSDVNHLIFEVLPRLAVGVHVHFHDIFYPFEYPRHWFEHFAWTENYLLRAFLQFNQEFKVCFFSDYLLRFHGEEVERDFPVLAVQGKPSTAEAPRLEGAPSSLWLRHQ
jgi:hypothetical protein